MKKQITRRKIDKNQVIFYGVNELEAVGLLEDDSTIFLNFHCTSINNNNTNAVLMIRKKDITDILKNINENYLTLSKDITNA